MLTFTTSRRNEAFFRARAFRFKRRLIAGLARRRVDSCRYRCRDLRPS